MGTSTLASFKPFDPTKPVQTRSGRKVRILCTDRKGSDFPVLALVTTSDGEKEIYETYTLEGGYLLGASNDDMDLVNIPEPAVAFAACVNGFDPAKPVQTRDGGKARIICADRVHADYPILALRLTSRGEEVVESYTADGFYSIHCLGGMSPIWSTCRNR